MKHNIVKTPGDHDAGQRLAGLFLRRQAAYTFSTIATEDKKHIMHYH